MLDLWKKEERQMLAEKKTVRHLLEGQSVANRVTVALRRVSSALTKKVAVFNSLGFSSTEGDLPATISLVDAKDTSSDLFLNFEEKVTSYNIPD
ncbi:UNVERIFIED_CONTAM: hypothetical protein FKN15_037182 [Acipenser sinensis]